MKGDSKEHLISSVSGAGSSRCVFRHEGLTSNGLL